MPATFAHPIAVYPFRRNGLWADLWSPLVVGSIAPDLLYLAPWFPREHYGHSWVGLFTFSLPASLFTLWLWHAVMKRSLVRLVPLRDQQVLLPLCGGFSFGPPLRFARMVVAILFAGLTHVLLDGFTHATGYFGKNIAWLNTVVLSLPAQLLWIRVYDLLYYLFSLLGTIFLYVVYCRWRSSAKDSVEVPERLQLATPARIAILMAIAMITVALTPLLSLPHTSTTHTLLTKAALIVGGAMRAFTYQIVVLSLFWYWTDRRHRPATEANELPPRNEPAAVG